MREYPDNHRRLFDGGDDLELASTLRAVFEVEVEHAPEQARPAHARGCVCVLLGVFNLPNVVDEINVAKDSRRAFRVAGFSRGRYSTRLLAARLTRRRAGVISVRYG